MTLDDYFVPCEISNDVFGFLNAIATGVDVKGFFAVFKINETVKATSVYSKEMLEGVVIPDILEANPGCPYKVFPESEFERITGKKV